MVDKENRVAQSVNDPNSDGEGSLIEVKSSEERPGSKKGNISANNMSDGEGLVEQFLTS